MGSLECTIVADSLEAAEFQMDATHYYRFRLPAGTRVRVEASGQWGFDGATHGPTGQQGRLDKRSPGYPKAPLGMLIGGISALRVDGPMDRSTAFEAIWGANTIPIGAGWEQDAPTYESYLYLICNDAWGTHGDNHGALTVKISIA
ncbi:MAG: hypothetical protein CHACPFDD_02124 [Phycisphaerae bacterium]|nr:hypothetical protein [Phycisphaerae bacterium]